MSGDWNLSMMPIGHVLADRHHGGRGERDKAGMRFWLTAQLEAIIARLAECAFSPSDALK
jgi:hypothetical protein